jgi:hypothetical protein
VIQHPTDEIVLGAIDRGLGAFGESPKQAIWYRLENDFHLERDAVPEKIEAFEDVLRKIFGLGYGFIGALFRQHLEEATGQSFQSCMTFSDCVNSLRVSAEDSEVHTVR